MEVHRYNILQEKALVRYAIAVKTNIPNEKCMNPTIAACDRHLLPTLSVSNTSAEMANGARPNPLMKRNTEYTQKLGENVEASAAKDITKDEKQRRFFRPSFESPSVASSKPPKKQPTK